MTDQERIIKNTTYLTSAFVGQKLLAFIYFVLIARFIGVEKVGQYTVALSFTTIFAIFIDLGTSPTITREIAKDKHHLQNYLSSLIYSKLFLSVLIYIIVIIAIHLLNYPEAIQHLVYISGLVMIADSFVLTLYSSLRGLHNLKFEAIGIIINQVIAMSIGLTGLLFITRNPIILMVAFLGGSTVNLIFAIYKLQKKYNVSVKPIYNKIILKSIYLTALPFAFSGIFTRVYSYIDSIILQKFMGDTAVGLYSVAYKIPFALQFIPSAFAASIYPAMSAFYKKDNQKLEQTWEKATIYLLILALPMLWGIYQLSDVVILQFYGNEYITSIKVLQTLIFGLVFIFLNFPLGSLLAACNKQSANTVLIGCTMVINISANLILIPRFSAIGAAYAFLISHGFLFVSSLIIANRLITIQKLKLIGIFLRIFIATFVMGVAVYYTKTELSWILSIPIGAITYAIFVLLLRIIKISEIKSLLSRT